MNVIDYITITCNKKKSDYILHPNAWKNVIDYNWLRLQLRLPHVWLLDYYKIIFISRPILARANMGFDFVSGQYRCLFSRCRKYAINSLIHGHFHIGLVIIPRRILALGTVSGQYGGLGKITRPIWKCPCINLYLLYRTHDLTSNQFFGTDIVY
jgi:hypothetical protein